jgi:hypothetical protein
LPPPPLNPSPRALTAADTGAFRAIRLKSLQTEPVYLGVPYEDEAKHTAQQWRERCTETPEHCFFGLFHGPKLIGLVVADRWAEDPSGKTALWKSAYFDPEYRGQKIALPMYLAREKWTRRRFDRAVFFIRDGNRRSTEIHIKNGARYLFTRQMSWGDRPPAPWHWYEKSLRPANTKAGSPPTRVRPL